MESRPVDNFWGRYALFLGLAMGLLLLNTLFLAPAPDPDDKDKQQADVKAPQDPQADGPVDVDPEADQGQIKPDPTTDQPPDDKSPDAQPADQPAAEKGIPKAPIAPARFATLGSVDPDSPYRMLVTFTSQGAAVVRIELSSPKFCDLEDRSGYLGHIVIDTAARGAGCKVDVVGEGTPAAKADLRPGDLIKEVNGTRVTGFHSLQKALAETKRHQEIPLTVSRDDKEIPLTATLGRRPLEVVRPENEDPLSFLLTLYQVDDQQLPGDPDQEQPDKAEKKKRSKNKEDVPRDERILTEISGLDLRTGNWVLLGANDDPQKPKDWKVDGEGEDAAAGEPRDQVRFARWLPQWDLVVVKTYQLARVPATDQDDRDSKAYHLQFDIEIHNVGPKARNVAYQLDGPTGMPTEGSWYANKVGPGWGIYGLRDILVSFNQQPPNLIRCIDIAKDTLDPPWQDSSLTFIGVDAQYFSSVLIPLKESPADIWFAQSRPIRVGAVDGDFRKITNTSCRVRSTLQALEPGQTFSHSYEIFAGPKRPPLLKQYGLVDTVFYGWFWWAAKPMLVILHFFHGIVRNYGLAIILLTVLVRGSMFPLSRKQAMGARKMQQLQPEIRKIMDKYKDDMEGRSKAQQELFKKHNYNPLSGCWVIFIQMPIFIGLYRSLMVDVELRQAPLLWNGIRWCSNLAAPDMLVYAGGFWKSVGLEWVIQGHDPSFMTMFALGPYFNLLPCLTIVLFLVQQKMLMPPATDEQTAMQQKIMKYMMVLMGLMFFKVAAGLCIYFIASSLWGVAERQLLPKAKVGDSASKPKTSKTAIRSSAERLKRSSSEPTKKLFPGLPSASDGATARKKKRKKGRKKK
jgi:YidC/Oxa1 family membrane protein insertase